VADRVAAGLPPGAEAERSAADGDPVQQPGARALGDPRGLVRDWDGVALNFSQVRAGWAKVYVFRRRLQRYRSFTRARRAARREGAGVWDLRRPFHARAPAAAAARRTVARTARVARRVSVNLDGDRRRERVELVARTRPNPYGGTAPIPVRYVRVMDWPRRRGDAAHHPAGRIRELPGARLQR
jgi:hypothetical protein